MRIPILAALIATAWLTLAGTATAQEVVPPPNEPVTAAEGRQTLEDILARQRGEGTARQPRPADTASDAAAAITGQLGTLGGASDPELWEALRFGTADVHVSAGGPQARVVMQEGGMWWQSIRRGPLPYWGGIALLGTIALLAIFYLVRGPVRIDAGRSGIRIPRFSAVERFAHWLLAGSFIVLAVTGLITLFGRKGLISFLGKDGYATLAQGSKWIHDNISWAFMLGLALVFVFWVFRNLPSRTDLVWIAKGGGIIGHGHPPARKFNAGQKLVFWAVILLGGSLALSGLSMLFPYQLPLFAKTFAILNDTGLPALVGLDPLPTQLAPQEEMQYAQLWHAIVGFAMMAVILGHIYIGTLGMEGAYEAMGTGEVDLNWAREHHSLWVEEIAARGDAPPLLDPAASR